MTACPDFEPLLLDRAAGDLAAAEADRLDAHLGACAACRAEAATLADVLDLARLPPPSPAERQALAGLADAMAPAARRTLRRSEWPLRAAVVVAAVAASAAFLLLPAVSRRGPTVGPADLAAAQTAAPVTAAKGWEPPDPDVLWDAVASVEPSTSTDDAVLDAAAGWADLGRDAN